MPFRIQLLKGSLLITCKKWNGTSLSTQDKSKRKNNKTYEGNFLVIQWITASKTQLTEKALDDESQLLVHTLPVAEANNLERRNIYSSSEVSVHSWLSPLFGQGLCLGSVLW